MKTRVAGSKTKTPPASMLYRQRFRVSYSYPVHFTSGLFNRGNTVLDTVFRAFPETPRRVLVYVDDGLASAWPTLIPDIQAWFRARPEAMELVRDPEIVPGGERTKNGWNVVQAIMSTIGAAHLCRHSYVMALGGGSVLDMVGFAASLVHRGIRMIRVPSTVLAQCDAGVGVKTGMDEHGMKNFAGTFAPPAAVLVDFEFLKTLSAKYRVGGVSEAIKVAMIKDAVFFKDLCRSARRIAAGDNRLLADAVRRSAILHLEHIRTGGDPFEFGAARPLDFGHWAAHHLEILSHYRLGHGQAVSIGLALDTCYAHREGLVSRAERDALLRLLESLGLPTWDPVLELADGTGYPVVLKGIEVFREHLGGQLSITLPDGIGRKREVHTVDMAVMRECMDWLKRRVAVIERDPT